MIKIRSSWLKPMMILQVIAGVTAVGAAFAYLRGVLTSAWAFIVPFIVFIALYISTRAIRKRIEKEAEKVKEEAQKAQEPSKKESDI